MKKLWEIFKKWNFDRRHSASVTDLIEFADTFPEQCKTCQYCWYVGPFNIWIANGQWSVKTYMSRANLDIKPADKKRIWKAYGRWNQYLIKLNTEMAVAKNKMDTAKKIRDEMKNLHDAYLEVTGGQILKETFDGDNEKK